MNGWTVELSKTAKRELRNLPEGPKRAAVELMEDLREQGPMVVPSIRMRAHHETWRARFHHEDYRMIYQVSNVRKRIYVKYIRVRPIAYDGLKH